jgi:Skp family chaperone for outer membrane proteins
VYIDIEKIMKESKAGKSIIEKINKTNKKNVKEFEKIEENLKKEEKDLIGKKNVLNEKEFEKKLQPYTENISCAFTFMCDYSGKIPLNFGL